MYVRASETEAEAGDLEVRYAGETEADDALGDLAQEAKRVVLLLDKLGKGCFRHLHLHLNLVITEYLLPECLA